MNRYEHQYSDKWKHCWKHVNEISKREGFSIDYHNQYRCYAYTFSNKILIRPIKGPTTYFIALHESGHIVDFKSNIKAYWKRETLAKETTAWQFAFDNSIIRPNSYVRLSVASCLRSYYEWEILYRPAKGREVPGKDSIFWEYLNHPKLPTINHRDWNKSNGGI